MTKINRYLFSNAPTNKEDKDNKDETQWLPPFLDKDDVDI